MDNKQLAILLDKYLMLLDNAIEAVKSALPKEMEVSHENFLGEEFFSFPILDDFTRLVAVLNEDIELLKKGEA